MSLISTPAALEEARSRFLTALARTATALARSLPADGQLAAGEIDDGAAGRDRLVPGPGARAVSAALVGPVAGRIVLATSAALAEAIEHGPVVTQVLPAGLEPALADAVAMLSSAAGEGLRHEAVQEVSADVAFGQDGDGAAFLAVSLIDGDQHVATLAVLLTAVEAEDVASAPVASFEPLVSRDPSHEADSSASAARRLEMLADVEMGVTAELGRTRMTVRDLLALTPGSVVELDRLAGSPVDVLVNGTLVARGEVVVIDEEFGVRISEIIGLDVSRARARTA
jgi:flagellar motor switch protein FliN/FliY